MAVAKYSDTHRVSPYFAKGQAPLDTLNEYPPARTVTPCPSILVDRASGSTNEDIAGQVRRIHAGDIRILGFLIHAFFVVRLFTEKKLRVQFMKGGHCTAKGNIQRREEVIQRNFYSVYLLKNLVVYNHQYRHITGNTQGDSQEPPILQRKYYKGGYGKGKAVPCPFV